MVAGFFELSGEPGCVAWLFVLSHGLRVAGWIAVWSGGVECSQDVEPGLGVPKFDDGTGGRREAFVEGGVDREETVGATPDILPSEGRCIADRVVRGADFQLPSIKQCTMIDLLLHIEIFVIFNVQ